MCYAYGSTIKIKNRNLLAVTNNDTIHMFIPYITIRNMESQ